MSQYRKIVSKIWNDEKFRSLSHDGQLFYLYLLTSPHSTAWGAYIIDDLYIQADLKMDADTIEKCWQEILTLGLAIRCQITRVVCFPNWYKYNLPTNEKSALACIRGLSAMPKSPVISIYFKKSQWLQEQVAKRNLNVSEFLANSDLTTFEPVADEQEQETEQEQEHKQETEQEKLRPDLIDPDDEKSSSIKSECNEPYIDDTHLSLEKLSVQADEVIDYLNRRCNRSFKHEPNNRKEVCARLKEGFTVDDCKAVIDWKRQNKFFREKRLLRPKTLFKAKHFATYLEESRTSLFNMPEDPNFTETLTDNIQAAAQWLQNNQKEEGENHERPGTIRQESAGLGGDTRQEIIIFNH